MTKERNLVSKIRSVFQGERRRPSKRSRRNQVRRSILEQLENRELLAVSILSVTPPDESLNVPVDTDLVINFDGTVGKGQGNIHVVRQSTGTLGVALDVRSPNVTIADSVVTIDLPTDLELDNTYSVFIDDGAFIDVGDTNLFPDSTLLVQNFEFLPLDPFETESGGDGTDFTKDPPLGFGVDNTALPNGGVPEWQGWSFADKESWIAAAGNQSRDLFTLGTGTVAVADPDEWDDVARDDGNFDSDLLSKPVDLTGVTANTVKLSFDSSYRPEDLQIGTLDFRIDDGAWTNLLTLDSTTLPDLGPEVNQNLTFDIDNPSAGNLQFRWKMVGANDWWWAIDNVRVAGEIQGDTFEGINDPTFWEFSTPESPRLSLTIDETEISENGGVATGTVTRNLEPSGDLVVELTSSDTTEATVPLTVTIPDGQASATFTITAVDDSISDRAQLVTITATDDVFAPSSQTISILDDEGPKLVTLTPLDDSTEVDYQTGFAAEFDVDIRKGQGRIHVVESATNALGFSVDVNDPGVIISGRTITIPSPGNLNGLTDYYVLIEDGAILDTTTALSQGVTLLTETFDLLPLNPAQDESGGDGTDWTKTPPLNFSVDDSQMPSGGVAEWRGWSFADRDFWAQAGGQNRADFERASGNVAVADPDEFFDLPTEPAAGAFNSFLFTDEIDVSEVDPGSLRLEFDSSFRPELPQTATVEVSYDGGAFQPLGFFTEDERNGRVVIDSTSVPNEISGGATIAAPLVTDADSSTVQFRFSMELAGNNWWWAIDNIQVTGDIPGLPFQGITDPTTWNFTTAEAPTVTVTTAVPEVDESAGTIVGTVSRNLDTTGDLVVGLMSSDTSEATVPAEVTIPAGQSSVEFVITVVDDTEADGTQSVTISAIPPVDFFDVPAVLDVVDDDFPMIVSVTPADDSTDVPVESDFSATFDQPVKKGNGFIHLLRVADGKVGFSIDVNSDEVTVAGDQVTINPASDIGAVTDYYVSIDDGAILGAASTLTIDATLLTQNFELLPLGPASFESGGDGTDFTTTPPAGYTIDNSGMVGPGVPEWDGWSFADRDFWAQAGGQDRSDFTFGQGTVAVADSDEFDDLPDSDTAFASLLRTPAIQLADVAANSVTLSFDSSFRPEGTQTGVVEVTFDGGTTWENLLTLDTQDDRNIRYELDVNNPADGTMEFRFGYTGDNNWWWAMDNLLVTGDVDGLPFPGISSTDTTAWNFRTEDGTLAITLDQTEISENGGEATATLTRNALIQEDLVVTLASDDTSEATVPVSVTIPAGSESVTFPVTAVNDSIVDSDQIVTLTAAASGFLNDPVTITVLTDDFPKVDSLSPVDGSSSVATDENLIITMDQDVKKGNGFLHIVNAEDGKADWSIDVNSAAVTIAGAVVTIDPPADLVEGENYYVLADSGAFLSSLATQQIGSTLLMQDFELLRLGPAVDESGGDGTDFTLIPPEGYTVDNTATVGPGVTEWNGWSFADNDFWAQAGGQDRSAFTLGQGTVAVADGDEFDDVDNATFLNPLLRTPPIQLDDVEANSVKLEFDSSFRPFGTQVGLVDVSFDGGTTWQNVLTLDTQDERNVSYSFDIANPGSGTMEFRFSYSGGNDWWWAFDNLKVTGTTAGLPFPGIEDATAWDFQIVGGDNTAPAVEQIIVGSTDWPDPFIDAVDGGTVAGEGNKLGYVLGNAAAPLPWDDIDRLYVQFSEPVTGAELNANFELLNSAGIIASSVTYDEASMTATVALTAPLGFGKYRFGVSDAIVDAAANALDGDADGNAGGIFDFRFDVVPGDGNRDGLVGSSDLSVYINNFASSAPADFNIFADWNGDGLVGSSDLGVFVNNFGSDITPLADPGAPFAGGGGGESFADFDSFFGFLGEDEDEDEDDDESGDFLAF